MRTIRIAGLALLATLAACSQGSPNTAPPGDSGDRAAKLHAAAECLRQHGISNFADPVLGANGGVYTDRRALENADNPRGATQAAEDACRGQLGAANWNPEVLPPAPAPLVAAGVKAAQCMRTHGLPNVKDPTANSTYTPGHGFGMSADELPPGADKRNPTYQAAASACRSLLDDEIKASGLDQLAGK
jgi:hypothetical protein